MFLAGRLEVRVMTPRQRSFEAEERVVAMRNRFCELHTAAIERRPLNKGAYHGSF